MKRRSMRPMRHADNAICTLLRPNTSEWSLQHFAKLFDTVNAALFCPSIGGLMRGPIFHCTAHQPSRLLSENAGVAQHNKKKKPPLPVTLCRPYSECTSTPDTINLMTALPRVFMPFHHCPLLLIVFHKFAQKLLYWNREQESNNKKRKKKNLHKLKGFTTLSDVLLFPFTRSFDCCNESGHMLDINRNVSAFECWPTADGCRCAHECWTSIATTKKRLKKKREEAHKEKTLPMLWRVHSLCDRLSWVCTTSHANHSSSCFFLLSFFCFASRIAG